MNEKRSAHLVSAMTGCTRLCTHVHHERNGLHLHCGGGVQAGVLQVLEDSRVESILGLQLLECAHRVWDVAAMHVDTMLGPNTIHLG